MDEAGEAAADVTPAAGGADAPAPIRPHVEAELKLVADPRVLGRLFDGPLLAARATGRVTRATLETTYFDTEDHRLRRRGLALRVRKAGRHFMQGLKSETGAGGALSRRDEWECPIPGATPDLALIGDPDLRRRMKLRDGEAVGPVFATRVRRRSCTVDHRAADGAAASVAVAYDRGTILLPQGQAPLGEIELELRDGSPAAVYDLALALLDAAPPLRVETRSKSLRAYLLATGAPPAGIKAPPLVLDASVATDAGMAAIFGACLGQWVANEAAARDGRDPEGVHQMRVGLRRLRSAIAVFRALIPVDHLGWLREETRWLIGSLGPARDTDVFLAELLAPVMRARPDDAGLAVLAARAAEAREQGYARARAAIAEERYARFVLRLGQWIEGRSWRAAGATENAPPGAAPLVDLAAPLLQKRHRTALKRGRRFKRLDAAGRHQLRLALKKLRYTAEFFASLYDRKAAAFIAATKSLQDDLGHLNDVAVAEARLRTLVDGAPPAALEAAGMVVGWHARGAMLLEADLAQRWRAFERAEPFWRAGGG